MPSSRLSYERMILAQACIMLKIRGEGRLSDRLSKHFDIDDSELRDSKALDYSGGYPAGTGAEPPTGILEFRPVPVVAGSYSQYLSFIALEGLRNRKDARYVSMAESLLGLPLGTIVVVTGTYATRRDWPQIKQTLNSCFASVKSLDLDGESLF